MLLHNLGYPVSFLTESEEVSEWGDPIYDELIGELIAIHDDYVIVRVECDEHGSHDLPVERSALTI